MALNPYVNIHTHHVGEGIHVLDIGTGKTRVNAGRERPLKEGQEVFYSVGVHPMRIGEVDDALTCTRDLLRAERVIALGECGLDRRSPVAIEEQKRVLELQVELSDQFRKPLIIHCVKAYPELIAIREKSRSVVPWIIHGFNNNGQILQQLLNHGFYISVGEALLHPRSNAFRLIASIPLDRLFLENDDREVGIDVIYEAASGITGIGMEELKRRILENYKNVFVV